MFENLSSFELLVAGLLTAEYELKVDLPKTDDLYPDERKISLHKQFLAEYYEKDDTKDFGVDFYRLRPDTEIGMAIRTVGRDGVSALFMWLVQSIKPKQQWMTVNLSKWLTAAENQDTDEDAFDGLVRVFQYLCMYDMTGWHRRFNRNLFDLNYILTKHRRFLRDGRVSPPWAKRRKT